jgi:hypothetical protein
MGPVLTPPAIAAQDVSEAIGVPEQLDVEVHSSVPSQRFLAPAVPTRNGQAFSCSRWGGFPRPSVGSIQRRKEKAPGDVMSSGA